jgi:hypothetical protein
MIDIRLKCEAGIFVNAQDITPTTEIISDLMTLFRDEQLVPSVFHELRPGGGLPGPQPRVRLVSPNNEWAISFASQRIYVNKIHIDATGSNIGDLDSFCLQATDFFERILHKFNKKANRFVLDSNSLLQEMTEVQLDKVYDRLYKPPHFYQKHPPFEWIWRSASRKPITIADLEDQLNIIATIQRVRGEMGSVTVISHFDRIKLAFDINTTDLNLEYRFDLSHMKSFLEQATKIHESLCEEMLGYIHG